MTSRLGKLHGSGFALRSLAGIAGGLSLFTAASAARAYDGCVLTDDYNGGGASLGILLSDDVQDDPYGWYGKTGVSSSTASDFTRSMPNAANYVGLNAGLSDVQANIWQSYSVDIADSGYDYGGTGTNYRGGVFGYRCPKGNHCSINLGDFSNKNQAWQCMRSYQNKTLTIPFQQTSFWVSKETGQQTRGLKEEWRDQVTAKMRSANTVDSVSNVTGYASLENLPSVCARLGNSFSPWCTENPGFAHGQDVIRLHWEGKVDPNVTAGSETMCAVEGILECLTPFCFYTIAEGTPVCDAVVGSKHVVIDVWLDPYVDPRTTDTEGNKVTTPFKFNGSAIRVSVESGTGSTAIRDTILEKLQDSNIPRSVRVGIYDAVGRGWCYTMKNELKIQKEIDFCNALPIDPATGSKSYVSAGARAFGFENSLNLKIHRMEGGYEVSQNTTSGTWAFFPPHGKSIYGTSVGHPQILTFNYDRLPQPQ